MNKVNIFTQS